MNCNWNQKGRRNDVLFFRHITQWSNLRGSWSFQRSECLLGQWAFEYDTARLRRTRRWATPLRKCWRGYYVSMSCSVSAAVLILAYAVFRICYHADTSTCVFRMCYHADTSTCLVPYLQQCWYLFIWSLLSISGFHENLKNSSTTLWDRPRQFSQNQARLIACVASIFDRTSLNKLCISKPWFHFICFVCPRGRDAGGVCRGRAAVPTAMLAVRDIMRAWQIHSSKHSATCIYYSR